MPNINLVDSNIQSFTKEVRSLVLDHLSQAVTPIHGFLEMDLLFPGKMLRTRLAARWLYAGISMDMQLAKYGCAAVEMIHTASLCHDDVIDGGLIRRSLPTLWRKTGSSSAILIGDILLCEAFRLVVEKFENSPLTSLLIQKCRETCIAEAEQDLVFRGAEPDQAQCQRIARGKTGALFSFIGCMCGANDEKLRFALEEAGYVIGTAYQLADDLLDVAGDEQICGKTLGTDAQLQQPTWVDLNECKANQCRHEIENMLKSVVASLDQWPTIQQETINYLSHDIHAQMQGNFPFAIPS